MDEGYVENRRLQISGASGVCKNIRISISPVAGSKKATISEVDLYTTRTGAGQPSAVLATPQQNCSTACEAAGLKCTQEGLRDLSLRTQRWQVGPTYGAQTILSSCRVKDRESVD